MNVAYEQALYFNPTPQSDIYRLAGLDFGEHHPSEIAVLQRFPAPVTGRKEKFY